ncbi:hypothetical protein JW865_06680 [Candidatus Bathyarchaeota archaeon]|nr:hypothetical protein [Candidatus Bathyarchaeota archaeon]
MTSGSAVKELAKGDTSLDNNAISRQRFKQWYQSLSRKNELYNRIRRTSRARRAMDAGIYKWKNKVQLRFITLTSSTNVDIKLLNRHFEILKKRIKRQFLSKFEYVKIKTNEGNGVIHLIYAGPYIPQTWLSRNWEEIHSSKVVDIRKLYFGIGLRNYLSSYLQDQGRLSYSWEWFKKGWSTAYKRIQENEKRKYMLVGRYGIKPPIFCYKAWSRWFYKELDPMLFQKFLLKYSGNEEFLINENQSINQELIEKLKRYSISTHNN